MGVELQPLTASGLIARHGGRGRAQRGCTRRAQVMNRIQKLRKQVGLVVSEPVEVWLGERRPAPAASAPGPPAPAAAACNGGAHGPAAGRAQATNGAPEDGAAAAPCAGAAPLALRDLLHAQARGQQGLHAAPHPCRMPTLAAVIPVVMSRRWTMTADPCLLCAPKHVCAWLSR